MRDFEIEIIYYDWTDANDEVFEELEMACDEAHDELSPEAWDTFVEMCEMNYDDKEGKNPYVSSNIANFEVWVELIKAGYLVYRREGLYRFDMLKYYY